MSIDTKYTYKSLPFNTQDQDRDPKHNRQGLLPSYRYKQPRVIWLSSFYASSTNASGNTTYSLTFNIPPFQLFNQTSLKVVSYISNESSAKPIIIKVDGLNYDVNSTYNADKEAFPTLYVNHTAVASQQYNNYFSMTLLPQQITTLTLYLNNSFTARNQGFTINTSNGAGHFILGLMFEDADLMLDNGVSQYK
jgi:hypothetical protein